MRSRGLRRNTERWVLRWLVFRSQLDFWHLGSWALSMVTANLLAW